MSKCGVIVLILLRSYTRSSRPSRLLRGERTAGADFAVHTFVLVFLSTAIDPKLVYPRRRRSVYDAIDVQYDYYLSRRYIRSK